MSVNVSGPLFDGRAERAMVKVYEEAAQRAGEYAQDEVRNIVGQDARRRTGYYESNITLNRSFNRAVVSDRGMRQGPWLEGTSRRNESTRYKGMHMFRRTVQEMNQSGSVEQIAEAVIKHHLSEMS